MRVYVSFLLFAIALINITACLPESEPHSISDDLASIEVDTIFGYPDDQYWFENRTIKNNQFMSDFFQEFGIAYHKIIKLETLADSTLSLRKIKAGNKMTCIKSGECDNPLTFIYQPDDFHYVTYALGDSVYTEITELPVHQCLETASGYIESNLWNAMRAQGLSSALIDKMEDALAAFDFTTSQVGDRYKLIFDKVYVDGEPKGVDQLHAAWYQTGVDTFMGVYFENEQYEGFYDEEGRPTKRAFLNAPIRAKYRISSVFNLRRFHPVDKRVKPHLGTDYAAAKGTPIRSVANGKVVIAGYTKNNGKYVKIRHDRTYQTQYLHMSGFASGIKSGKHVKQGQTIGYVGMTGKATGPHVCFRFWKNGRQIDHRRENFPPLDPMPEEQMPEYQYRYNEMSRFLTQISSNGAPEDLSFNR